MNHSSFGPLLVLAGALCFSTTGFTQALIQESGATPLVLGSARLLVGTLVLFLWLAWQKKLPSLHGWPIKNVIFSAFGIVGFQVFFFTGALKVGVAVGTVVAMGSTPIVAAILSAIFLREPPSRAWYPSTAVALFGMFLIGSSNGSINGDVPFFGFILTILAGAAYALYLTACKGLANGHTPEQVMLILFAICTVLTSPFFVIESCQWMLTLSGALGVLHLGIVTTALAYSLLLAGLRVTPPSTAATLGLAEPAGAALLGFFALGEEMTFNNVTGILCIIGSALLLIFLPKLRAFKV